MPLSPEEIEKLIKSLGAELVSLREELKAAPKANPDDIAAIKAEMASVLKRLDELKDLGKKIDPPPPDPVPTPRKPRRGFGFFTYE